MKKIFVTGATGFVGANLVRTLIKKNYEVHIIKRNGSDIWRIKDILPKLHLHEIDLLEKKPLAKLLKTLKPNIIFHLANLGLYNCIDPTLNNSLKVNLLGTVNLIEASHNINYDCFINTGSSSEYGDKNTPMAEENVCQPTNNYALSKLAATLYAKSYAQKTQKPLATLRLFSPYGPFDHPARFITQTTIKLLKKEEIVIRNPFSVRDYIFIDDVIVAYLQCIKKSNNLSGEIFNIGSGKQITVTEILELLMQLIPTNSRITFNNSIATKNMWQASIKKSQQILDWQPKTNLKLGLIKTITWFKKNNYYYDG